MGRGPYKNTNELDFNSLRTFKTYRANRYELSKYEKEEHDRRIKEKEKQDKNILKNKENIALSRFAQAIINNRRNEYQKQKKETKYRTCRLTISAEQLANIMKNG